MQYEDEEEELLPTGANIWWYDEEEMDILLVQGESLMHTCRS